ncbi:MAG: hypothetical protein JXR03_10625 [Cyclobacteriaceae bacterium]
MEDWKKRLELYDELVSKCSRFERKGKTMPYTSANGYMFSLLNKAGEIGIRFSKERQKQLMEALDTTLYKSYGAVMQGYILIPNTLLENLDAVAKYLDESFNYVMGLEPK